MPRKCIHCGKPIRQPEQVLYCADCKTEQESRERQRVQTQNYRAAQAGLEATLTLEDWLQTIADFNGRCAYCLERRFEHLEHFVPIDAGGGTTLENCVPACGKCNYSKGADDPDSPQLSLFAGDPRERIRQYLAERAEQIGEGFEEDDF